MCLITLTLQISSVLSKLGDNFFDDHTGGVRARRAVKNPQTLAMLEKLRSTPGWEYLEREKCGVSSMLVYRSKRSVGKPGDHPTRFNVTSRIVGGTEVKPGQYPWMARIFYKAGPVLTVGCGGALITKWHVLTAAHCVAELPSGVKVASVRVGVEGHYQSLSAASANIHNGYDSGEMANDIAIIKLGEAADLNDYVGPLCLPLGDLAEKGFVGQSAIVAGWGKTESSASSSELLMVQLPVIDNASCRKKIASYPIRANQLCAGGDKGKDSCNGDSGGPLFLMDRLNGPFSPSPSASALRYVIIGVVSYGSNDCGQEGIPGVYSRVSYFLPWILKNMT